MAGLLDQFNTFDWINPTVGYTTAEQMRNQDLLAQGAFTGKPYTPPAASSLVYEPSAYDAYRQQAGGSLWDGGSVTYLDNKNPWLDGTQLDPSGQYFDMLDTDRGRVNGDGRRDRIKVLYQNINGKATPINAAEQDAESSWSSFWKPYLSGAAAIGGGALGLSALGSAIYGAGAGAGGAAGAAGATGATSFPVYSPSLAVGTPLGPAGAAAIGGAAGGAADATFGGAATGGATSSPVYSPSLATGTPLGPAGGSGLLSTLRNLPPGSGRIASSLIGGLLGGAGAGGRGSPGDGYSGPIAPVDRGGWQPSVGYSPQAIDRPALSLPQTGEQNDGLWRFMRDNPIQLRQGLLDAQQAQVPQRAGLLSTPPRKISL